MPTPASELPSSVSDRSDNGGMDWTPFGTKKPKHFPVSRTELPTPASELLSSVSDRSDNGDGRLYISLRNVCMPVRWTDLPARPSELWSSVSAFAFATCSLRTRRWPVRGHDRAFPAAFPFGAIVRRLALALLQAMTRMEQP